MEAKINFEDFKKVEITVGKILSAEKIPDTDKLLKLSVDFGVKTVQEPPPATCGGEVGAVPVTIPPLAPLLGDHPQGGPFLESKEGGELGRDIRQIISGIALHFPEPSMLVGKKCMFVTNLEPRIIKGFESNGMLFAVSTDDGKFSLLEPSVEIPEGTRAK